MEKKLQHTPLPWQLEKRSSVSDIGIYGNINNDQELIALLNNDAARAKINAEFIVRAVNNHTSYKTQIALLLEVQEKDKAKIKALVEAAKHLLIFSGIIQQDAFLDEKFDQAKDDLRNAVAQAEGKL